MDGLLDGNLRLVEVFSVALLGGATKRSFGLGFVHSDNVGLHDSAAVLASGVVRKHDLHPDAQNTLRNVERLE